MYWKFILKSSQSRKAPKQPAFKPKLEELEDRRLLSITSAVFAVDPNSSAVTLSGDVAGSTILPQGNGSLTSNFSGSIVADWDLSAQTIKFDQPGTALNASITGNWQPQVGGASGSAPANYGGKVTIVIFTANIALRNLVVSGFTASPIALSGSGPYSFPSTQTLIVTSGTADYNAPIVGSGSTDLTGLSSNNKSPVTGTFEDLGNGSYRLTEPIDLTVQQTVGTVPATLHIQGQIVANTVLPVINLIGSSATAVGGAGAVPVADPASTVTHAANLTSMTVRQRGPVGVPGRLTSDLLPG